MDVPFWQIAHANNSMSEHGSACRPYTHCEWLIEPGYGPIQLSFECFSLAAGDTLDVYGGTTADPSMLLASYAGHQLAEQMT